MSFADRCFAAGAFPLLLTVAVVGSAQALAAGSDPAITVVVAVAGVYLTIAILERVKPLHESWRHSRGDLGPDIAWFATNGLLNRVVEPITLALSTAFGGWLSGRVGLDLWPAEWPLLAQLPLALIVAEFFEYWFHRLMHEVPWLWRFHATHHSAPRLYWLNAVRFHPVDYVAVGIGKLVPLAVLGAPVAIFALVNVFSAVHGAFQHANVPVRIGPLNWIFSMAELHRWHHSRRIAESNTNYGGNLIFWDLVFGTRFLPDDREPPEDIGLAGPAGFPNDYLGQLLSPMRWRDIESSGGNERVPTEVV